MSFHKRITCLSNIQDASRDIDNLQVVVLNAAIESVLALDVMKEESIEATIQANVLGMTLLTNFFIKEMNNKQFRSCIIGASSIASFMTFRSQPYAATRAYQTRFFRDISDMLVAQQASVYVSLVETDVVKTESLEDVMKLQSELVRSGITMMQWEEPDDYVNSVLKQVIDQGKRYVLSYPFLHFLRFLSLLNILPDDAGEPNPLAYPQYVDMDKYNKFHAHYATSQ